MDTWNPKSQGRGFVGSNDVKNLDQSYFMGHHRPLGVLFSHLLDSLFVRRPLNILEIGTMRDTRRISEFTDGWSTLYIARWVSRHQPQKKFLSVDADPWSLNLAWDCLKYADLHTTCEQALGESLTVLKTFQGARKFDFIFLDSCDGLEHGLEEFRLAEKLGPRLILMDDLPTKAQLAVDEAVKEGWHYKQTQRYAVLRRGS